MSYEELYRKERFPLPMAALREAILNAVVHKDYASNVAIQISIYPNKLMIWNPGQLPENWTLEKLMAKHASHPFNPDIANAFFRAGLIESWGRGIERITQACEEEGYPRPLWQLEPGGVWVTFSFIEEQKSQPRKTSEGVSEGVSEGPNQLLMLITDTPGLRTTQISKSLNVPTKTLERWLKALRDENKVEFRGAPKTGGYFSIEDSDEKK